MARTRTLWAAIFLSLPLAVYVVIVIVPLLTSFRYSVTNWNGFDPNFDFVGLDNYTKIWTDRLFRGAVINTLIWMAAAILLPTTAGLTLALALNGRGIAGNVYKSLFYLPICLSLAVIGQVWIWIYHPDWGLLNVVLGRLGLESWQRA